MAGVSTVPADPRKVVILGMHRSGTSCLTRILESNGFWVGDSRGDLQRSSRRRAVLEDPGIRTLNNELLAANGGSWQEVPDAISWTPADEHRARALMSLYEVREPWVIKDPRLLPLWDFWQPLLGSPSVIGTFRNPVQVSRSLAARNGIDLTAGETLWRTYNATLWAIWTRNPFPLIEFGVEPEVYLAQLSSVLENLATTGDADGLSAFDPTLVRNSRTEARASPNTMALYQRLRSAAADSSE